MPRARETIVCREQFRTSLDEHCAERRIRARTMHVHFSGRRTVRRTFSAITSAHPGAILQWVLSFVWSRVTTLIIYFRVQTRARASPCAWRALFAGQGPMVFFSWREIPSWLSRHKFADDGLLYEVSSRPRERALASRLPLWRTVIPPRNEINTAVRWKFAWCLLSSCLPRFTARTKINGFVPGARTRGKLYLRNLADLMLSSRESLERRKTRTRRGTYDRTDSRSPPSRAREYSMALVHTSLTFASIVPAFINVAH